MPEFFCQKAESGALRGGIDGGQALLQDSQWRKRFIMPDLFLSNLRLSLVPGLIDGIAEVAI